MNKLRLALAAALALLLTVATASPAAATVPAGYAQAYGHAYWDRNRNNVYDRGDVNLGRVTVVVKHTPRGGCAGTSGSWCRTHSTYLASGKTNTYGNYRFNFRVSGPDSYIAYTTNPYYLNAYYRTYKLIPYYYEVSFGASSGHTVHLNWAYRG